MYLREIADYYRQLLEVLEDPDYDDDVITEMLNDCRDDLHQKADNFAGIINHIIASAKEIKVEEDRLFQRRKSLENRAAYLKRTLEECMRDCGETKFKTTLYSFGIQKNPPSVIMDEQYIENIPADYLIYKDPEIDKKKLLSDLKAGVAPEGIAHIQQTESLRIR